MSWNKNYNKCLSCEGTEWEYRAKGYCTKCYPLIKLKTVLESWNSKDPKTIIPIGPVNQITINLILHSNKVNDVKKGLIDKIDSQIHLYKLYNSPTGDAMTIEFLIERVVSFTNNLNNDKLFHGAVTRYRDNLNAQQRKIILKDLAYILINRRVKFDVWEFII
nr:hypothetical protein [uncultured Flavobacterium sp.]